MIDRCAVRFRSINNCSNCPAPVNNKLIRDKEVTCCVCHDVLASDGVMIRDNYFDLFRISVF